MYRIIKNLDYKGKVLPPGSLSALAHLSPKTIALLLERGVIRQAQSPPLVTLAGWQHRAKRLAEIDIVTIEQFLAADPAEIGQHLRVRPPSVNRWRTELTEWTEQEAPPPDRR